MNVDVVTTSEEFAGLVPAWDAVHRSDPEAGYFMSARWLSEVFRTHPGEWMVLAARPDWSGAAPVAFLPLRVKERWSESRGRARTELEAAGRLSWGQYTGFVCDPSFDQQAIPAFAGYLRSLSWSRLKLEKCSASIRRLDLFADGFPPVEFRVTGDRSLRDGAVDNRICPFVRLPEEFDTYLSTCVSSNMRQKIRRFSRRLDDSEDLRITRARPDEFADALDSLLDLWRRKWAPRRGSETTTEVSAKYREILMLSQRCDAVFLPILWRDDRPLGALAHIIDAENGRLHFIVAGRDESAPDPFIGLMLHADSIRWAVEHGFQIYDFCHGNESYKYSFGATDRTLRRLSVTRRSATDAGE